MSYLPIFQTNADKKLEQLEKENAELKAQLIEVKALLAQAVDRIEDMLLGDDGQAWKEASKFLESAPKLRGK